MIQIVEAVIDEHGSVQLLHPVKILGSRRKLVTIFDEKPAPGTQETAVPSESALAKDWNRPEEDTAWSHLQPVS